MPIFINDKYEQYLKAFASLTKLFSDNTTQLFIHSKFMESCFSKCFHGQNIATSNKFFDAVVAQDSKKYGLALKTFGVGLTKDSEGVLSSKEKIAEFTHFGKEIAQIINQGDIDLALSRIIKLRNERILTCINEYGTDSNNYYHCIGRNGSDLYIFEEKCSLLNKELISKLKSKDNVLSFCMGEELYSYSIPKSTLYKQFIVKNYHKISVTDIKDPFVFLDTFKDSNNEIDISAKIFHDQIVIPLYSTKKNIKYVPEKSGLNQWNANGRERKYGEIYLPFPAELRNLKKDFFPKRGVSFKVLAQNGEIFSAKVCQAEGKAVMTNPNIALSDWLLKTVLRLKEYEILTYEKLIESGIDSLKITNLGNNNYLIETAGIDSYETYLENIKN